MINVFNNFLQLAINQACFLLLVLSNFAMAYSLLTRTCKNLTSLLSIKCQNGPCFQNIGRRLFSNISVIISKDKSLLSSPGSQSMNCLASANCEENGSLAVLGGSTLVQVRCYQNVLRPRLICDGCYFVWRHGWKHVECSDFPRHKQIKKLSPRKYWKEDYSKGKIYVAHDWNQRPHREFYRTVDRNVVSHNWLADKLGKAV